jgi:hypothetical protein
MPIADHYCYPVRAEMLATTDDELVVVWPCTGVKLTAPYTACILIGLPAAEAAELDVRVELELLVPQPHVETTVVPSTNADNPLIVSELHGMDHKCFSSSNLNNRAHKKSRRIVQTTPSHQTHAAYVAH